MLESCVERHWDAVLNARVTGNYENTPIIHHTRHSWLCSIETFSSVPINTLQSLCLVFLSLEDGFRQLSLYRLDGKEWKERCSGPIGRPAAKSSSAAV